MIVNEQAEEDKQDVEQQNPNDPNDSGSRKVIRLEEISEHPELFADTRPVKQFKMNDLFNSIKEDIKREQLEDAEENSDSSSSECDMLTGEEEATVINGILTAINGVSGNPTETRPKTAKEKDQQNSSKKNLQTTIDSKQQNASRENLDAKDRTSPIKNSNKKQETVRRAKRITEAHSREIEYKSILFYRAAGKDIRKGEAKKAKKRIFDQYSEGKGMNSETSMQKGPLIISKIPVKSSQLIKLVERQKSMNLNNFHEIINKSSFICDNDTPSKNPKVNKLVKLTSGKQAQYQNSPESVNRRDNYKVQTPGVGVRNHLNKSEIISSIENPSANVYPHPPIAQLLNSQLPGLNSNSSVKSKRYQGKHTVQSHYDPMSMSLIGAEEDTDSFASVLKVISYKKNNTGTQKHTSDPYEQQRTRTAEAKGRLSRCPRGAGANMYYSPAAMQKGLINKGYESNKNNISDFDIFLKEEESSFCIPTIENSFNTKLEPLSGSNSHLISLHKIGTGEQVSPKKNKITGKKTLLY